MSAITLSTAHSPPVSESQRLKRQKIEVQPHLAHFTGIFDVIVALSDTLKVEEIVENILVEQEILVAFSTIENFNELENTFSNFLVEKNATFETRPFCFKVLKELYVTALNNSPIKQELITIAKRLKELNALADQNVLKQKLRRVRTAKHSEKIHILAEIQQLRPFLDEARNRKLYHLAYALFAKGSNEINFDFLCDFLQFVHKTKELSIWILAGSEYNPQLHVKKPTQNLSPHEFNEDFLIYAMPLLEAAGELFLQMFEKNINDLEGYAKANAIWEELFFEPEFQTVEWMNLIHVLISELPDEIRKDLLTKLAIHHKNILSVASLDETARQAIQLSEKTQMKQICLRAFKVQLKDLKLQTLPDLKEFFKEKFFTSAR